MSLIARVDARRMRVVSLALVLVSLVTLSGCTSSILGVLLAPESVVGGGAESLAQVGAQTLSGASLNDLADLGNTVTELDRIITEHPDAANVDSLKSLRDHLKDQAGRPADTGPDQRQAKKEPPAPRRPTDQGMPVRMPDQLSVLPPNDQIVRRRPSGRPEALPTGNSLLPDYRPIHAMMVDPVRLTR